MQLIEGYDIVIQSISPYETADQLLLLAVENWPNLILEDADTGDEIPFHVPTIQPLPNEFFVYRDAAIKKRWDEEGACDEPDDTMMHVLINSQALTVVVDDPEAEINRKVIGTVQDFAQELQTFRYSATT